MKTLFVDCNVQFEKVFRKVYRADDPPVTVNNDRFTSEDLPRLLDGYDICIAAAPRIGSITIRSSRPTCARRRNSICRPASG